MYNRRYEKVFLMLRQETAGYGLGKRPPWGSCVMELKNGKGRLHLTIQGLKPLQYEVYVMAGTESIFCGEILPEQKEGRCDFCWDFDPDAIGDGKTAEELDTVLILAEGTSAPLTAYFREKQDWKQNFTPREKKQSVQAKTLPEEEKITLQTAETKLPKQPASLEETETQKPTHEKIADDQKGSYHGSFQGLLAKFRQELEELEETGILTQEETENIRSLGPETKIETKEKPKQGLFTDHPEWVPFGDGEGWKRLSLEELTLLSQIPLKWQKEFFFLLPWRKYHHLILQEKEDGIWLGLPGQFNARDAADAHAFGFHEFRNTEGDWGYWMAFLEGNP